MATLTNTQISVTYVGLLKTSANTVLTSTAQQITDGDGNNSIMFLSTAGVGIGGSPASGKELDVTGNVQVTGDLIIDNITIDGSTITNASGDLTIVNTTDDGDILLQTDNGSGGTTTYLQLDGGSVIVQLKKDLYALDNVKLRAGNAGDLQIYHDATDSYIENDTGDLIIRNNADDKDIIFQSDDGSGGVETYFKLDGGDSSSNPLTLFPDNARAGFGASADLIIYHDGSNSYIQEQGTGDLRITTSGGAVRINKGVSENIAAFIPDGAVELYHNNSKKFETKSTGVQVQSTGTATLTLLDADDSSEVSINHNASVTTLIYSDLIFDNGGGNNVLQLTNSISALENISLPDSKQLNIGSSGADLRLTHSGTDSFIQNFTGNLQIQQQADDKDILFRGDDGSGGITTYFRLNGDNSDVIFDSHIELEDNVELRIGSSGADLRMLHNGSNSLIQNFVGDLEIHQEAADKDVLLRCDDGSGSISTYILLDGSEVATKIETVKIFMSNLPTSNPSVAGQLYNDSGTLKISAG